MRSSSRRRVLPWVGAGLLIGLWSPLAEAQQQASGFDLERLYTSAPGGGWIVMDALDMHGGLGGAVNLVTSYARNPLRITQGSQHLAVVSDEAFLELGLAATYDRFRLYVSFDSPLTVQGNSGTLGGYTFTAPNVDLGSSPDAISHGRLGFDARILGEATGLFRLGLGAQIWFPGGAPGSLRNNYLSDGPPGSSLGAYTGTARALFAGDVGRFAYAGQLGFNLRSLDDSPTPGSPQGSELLLGVAGGVKLPVLKDSVLVIGPEVYGATAFRAFLSTTATALEGLLSTRVEGTRECGAQVRVKLGTGGGINAHFGAPEWRAVFAIELFDRNGCVQYDKPTASAPLPELAGP